MNVRQILEDMGYSLTESGNEYRAKPIYRNSSNSTSLSIKKDSGRWIDFGLGVTGTFEELIKRTLSLTNLDEARKVLHEKQFDIGKTVFVEKLKEVKIFDKEVLFRLDKDHSYWVNRGISEKTMELFMGGVAGKGKMDGRYVFPIFNSNKKIVGFTGRAIKEKKIKWKHVGAVQNWVYPAFLNYKDIDKQVILVESIGDLLALYDAGIKHVLVCFGLKISSPLLNFLIKKDVENIIVSLNNDAAFYKGEQNAINIKKKLNCFFDEDQIKVALPSKNDFGEMNKEEILIWAKDQNVEYQPQE